VAEGELRLAWAFFFQNSDGMVLEHGRCSYNLLLRRILSISTIRFKRSTVKSDPPDPIQN
jgi:hypothetical protein